MVHCSASTMTFGGFSSATQRSLALFFLHPSFFHRTLLSASSPKSHLPLPSNLLSVLVRSTRIPTKQSELHSWWVPKLRTKPPRPKYIKKMPSLDGITVNELGDDGNEVMEEKIKMKATIGASFFDDRSPDDALSAGSLSPERGCVHQLSINLFTLLSHTTRRSANSPKLSKIIPPRAGQVLNVMRIGVPSNSSHSCYRLG